MSTYIRAVVAAKAIAEKYGIPLGDLVDTFADIPAADVVPVRRGRWIEKTAHDRQQYFECSNCGKQENKHTAIRGGFCWNCGAKMDETKEGKDEHDKSNNDN